MSTTIYGLIEAAHKGDWSPLIKQSKKASGKDWAKNARCANQNPDIFLPLGDGPRKDPEVVKSRLGSSLNRPRNFCAACPLAVAARCLVESLKDDDEFGIRAGLLASERSALRSAWQKRVGEEAVEAALQGATAVLSKDEREAAIARFAADPSLDPVAVARGLGVTREYLLKLARRHRAKEASMWAESSPPGCTKAA
ncbi:WhiB family transcriptional regulator [Streptomyces murinus]|uniref:WhiB family transcriptional regulator n=1 Tax=Streptomyces murinus TaxID=33900 RepID=UPI003830D1C9